MLLLELGVVSWKNILGTGGEGSEEVLMEGGRFVELGETERRSRGFTDLYTTEKKGTLDLDLMQIKHGPIFRNNATTVGLDLPYQS
jgi:hypothetical protein